MEEMRDGQSIELLKELHILTRDGKINQDSRRKLKQVYHLYGFVEPLLKDLLQTNADLNLVDHGAGKSYLGFIIYDLFFKDLAKGHVYGVETRDELVKKSSELQKKFGFKNMSFLNVSVNDSIESQQLPEKIDIVTALHACDTATDDAIDFALRKNTKHIFLVPCCQAEVAKTLKQNKPRQLANPLTEIWRHPIHTREFGSHLTNVLRCLRLEAHGYKVTVTELVGHEHSMKNELIVATKIEGPRKRASDRLHQILEEVGLQELQTRFSTPANTESVPTV
ncbi:MAG: SAM-dependent methyltransferase [Bdellovibrionales bacterium]|nr:SAM-dependent methyltransferase [Bdellovibrionales bacterium]